MERRDTITVVALLLLSSTNILATTTETTITNYEVTTFPTTAEIENFTTTPLEQETTTTTSEPFTIRVPPLVEGEQMRFQGLPGRITDYVYEVKDGDLQDIGAEESNNHNKIYIHFEPEKYKSTREVEVTSFVADSDTALKMNVEEAIADVRNRSGGADMISAFFVAPEDEVYENKIDRKKAEERGDLGRVDRYGQNTAPGAQNSLTDEILAPLQAAVSLSHGNENRLPQPKPTTVEKQTLEEMPVYKTVIEIQKSIPIEIKEEEQQQQPQPQQHPQQAQEQAVEEPRPSQQYVDNSIVPQIMLAYQIPQYRTPVYYRYPMYYIPQSYIGNYIMRHSHENTGIPAYVYRPRPYYYLRLPPGPLVPQTQVANGLPYPVHYTPAYPEPEQQPSPVSYQDVNYPDVNYQEGHYHNGNYPDGNYRDEDQNTLQSEPALAKLGNVVQSQERNAPFRPSQHVFSSVYPPHTYRVPLTMVGGGRGLHARSVRSKQLCIEYGGFKPPMVPSVQIEESAMPKQAQEKSSVEEENNEA